MLAVWSLHVLLVLGLIGNSVLPVYVKVNMNECLFFMAR